MYGYYRNPEVKTRHTSSLLEKDKNEPPTSYFSAHIETSELTESISI